MTESRRPVSLHRGDTTLAKVMRVLAERAGRLADAIAPQPQLQPVPVRVRVGRNRSHR